MFHVIFVMLSCMFSAALWSPVWKGLTSWLSYALRLCHFPISFTKVTAGTKNTCLSPSVIILLTVLMRCFFRGSFLLFMFHVCLYSAVLSVPCRPVTTCWVRALSSCVFFHFTIRCLGSGVALDCIDS